MTDERLREIWEETKFEPAEGQSGLEARAEYLHGTLLTYACAGGYVFICRELVAAGADLNARDEHGFTALMAAACVLGGSPEMVDILLKAGADPNRQDNFHKTALMKAAWAGHARIVDRLINAGADLETRDTGWLKLTALEYAVSTENLEVAKILVEAGANITDGVRKAIPEADHWVELARIRREAGADGGSESGDLLL